MLRPPSRSRATVQMYPAPQLPTSDARVATTAPSPRGSGRAPRRSPRSLLAVAMLAALGALAAPARPLAAQLALTAATDLVAAPGGRAIATLRPGAVVSAGVERGAYVQVTVRGYVSASLLSGGGRGSRRTVTVRPSDGARLRDRASTDAGAVAALRGGVELEPIARRGDWIQVRRRGWV